MTIFGTPTCQRWARVIGVIVITALVPLPALADGASRSQQMTTLKASAARMVAREVAAASPATMGVREDRQGAGSTNSTSFFKSRPGMIALAVMAAGAGYAVYSASHDRIQSAGKK